MQTHDRVPQQTRPGRLAELLLAGLIALTVYLGLAGAAAAAPPSEEIPFGEGVLWQVQRPGGEPSYVFGTIHLNSEDILAVPEAVRRAFEDARSASFELTPDDATYEERVRLTRAKGRNTLDALLGPDLFAEVVEAAEPYGLNVHQVRHRKAWAIVKMFDKPPSVVAAEKEADSKPILDYWLYERARERGIPTFALETARQHLSPFLDISREDQRRLVRAVLDTLVRDQIEVERRHAELVRLYLEGRIDTLMESGRDEVPTGYEDLATDFTRRLLDDRNHLMVERMLPRLVEGRAFVAIGAAHLPGHEGIIALLGEHGYSARRLH